MIVILFIFSQWTSFLNSTYCYDMVSLRDILLIGTSGGALVFNKKDTSFIAITNLDGLLSNDVVQVGLDKYGNWWFVCRGGGITVMSQNRAMKRNFTEMDGVPSSNFSSLFIDGDIVWVGTDDNEKVWRFNMGGDPFVSSNILPLLEVKPTNEVKKIQLIGDSVWFGTTKGIGVTHKNECDSFIVYDVGLPNDTVLA
ncbi:MAG: hypothetical protein HY769_04355, partial [Candidatus Stahlbacteria bacterium]|nr:hypothetical protein [Candidatus Stahlbacteria bacterium]